MLIFPPMFPKSINFRNFSGPLHLGKSRHSWLNSSCICRSKMAQDRRNQNGSKMLQITEFFYLPCILLQKMPPPKRFRKQTLFCTYRCGRKQSMNMSANHDHSTGSQTRSCSGSCLTYSSRVRINIDLVYPSLSHHRASHRARHTIFFLVRSCIAGSRWCKMYWHHSKQQNVNSHKCCTDFSMSENNA